MNPAMWGWTATDNGLRPVSTDIAPAPEALLKVIQCDCTTDCSSARCSCQKHSLKCVDLAVKTQLPILKMRMKKLNMRIPSMPSN